jgi:hypothetical protein
MTTPFTLNIFVCSDFRSPVLFGAGEKNFCTGAREVIRLRGDPYITEQKLSHFAFFGDLFPEKCSLRAARGENLSPVTRL